MAANARRNSRRKTAVFSVKDCALIAIATGRRAATLKELWEHLRAVDADSIYAHFWGNLLHPRFEEREFNNDFARWAHNGLHDDVLAERLAVVDPDDYHDMEGLRQELEAVIEERMDEPGVLPWTPATQTFEFIRSQIVVFDTRRQLQHAGELAALLPHMSTSSIFYHFIDARRRLPERIDDFRAWLMAEPGDNRALCDDLAAVDPYFGSLHELRARLAATFAAHFSLQADA